LSRVRDHRDADRHDGQALLLLPDLRGRVARRGASAPDREGLDRDEKRAVRESGEISGRLGGIHQARRHLPCDRDRGRPGHPRGLHGRARDELQLMTSTELAWLPALELASLIRSKAVSPVDVVDAVLARIERLNPRLNAYCTVTAEEA